MNTDIELSRDLINRLNKMENVDSHVNDSLKDTGFFLERRTKQNLTNNRSVISGALRRSIYTKIDKNSLEVGTKIKYAPYVEFGTSPHTIEPKRAKALYFNGVFAKRVNHPGSKPKPFLLNNKDEAEKYLIKKLEEITG